MHVYCSKQHANKESNRFCIQCGEPLPLPIGQMVENRYRIIRLLGQGGFGRTYLAVDTKQSDQKCVLKEFAPQVDKPEDLKKAKELFEREASVLRKLQHEQIPRFHSWLQQKVGNKDFFFLVQEYVEGENYWDLLLKRLTQQGKSFSEEEVIKLLEQILPVLSYIHSLDVIHRDISPDNLMLRYPHPPSTPPSQGGAWGGMPVLIDFGGVKQLPASQGFWFTRLAGNRTLLGKKGYAPEEQLRQGKAFPCSDLYSLAVTALVLLTGKEPQHLYDSYQGSWGWGKSIKVSAKLEAILQKMLAYKPSDRYQRADQVLNDLRSSTPAQPVNKNVSKIRTMIVAPGKRVNAVASQMQNRTVAISQAIPLPIWLRPFAWSLAGTTAVILTFAGTWAVVNALVGTVSSIKFPSISLPKSQEKPDSARQPLNNQETSRISQLISRRQQLEISDTFFNVIVNDIFYTKNPELQGRSLTGSREDEAFRKEWFNTADDLLNKIEQAKLSTATRRKMGSYGPRDYETWRQQAQAGELGNYTVIKLNKETNEKFDRLFPGERRGKLKQQTFGQIWYAIAADRVSKIESAR
ncbi:serine/threonine-protein kinase [Iningainema tapete]|uniref:non-specific serine/threonine protein kinase n=1 Tax=Iningainema tapete BLCC-T55 TaxID=2748662 RepID=A0A8J6XP80_9CYAN|nr:serine/threonine-protein kinase [Iningainema tapete]MBD2776726.1 serine/threonine protein kinase [Iningainema tapete BLCC-T55]